jgi:hypothetical protein
VQQNKNIWTSTKIFTGFGLAIAALAITGLVSVLFPSLNKFALSLIGLYAPLKPVAEWIKNSAGAQYVVVLIVTALMGVWWLMKFFTKIVFKAGWNHLLNRVQTLRNPVTPPQGCATLSDLGRRLYPDQSQIELVGRESEIAWLADQCEAALASESRIRVLNLYGPQGIGKTHLAYEFGQRLLAGKIVNAQRWRAWFVQNREFNPESIIDASVLSATLLIWDDVSLEDDSSRSKLDALRTAAQRCRKPFIVLLTGWRSRSEESLTPEGRSADSELEVKPLTSEFAKKIFPNADALKSAESGHPLLLRLLANTGAGSGNVASINIWDECLKWGKNYKADRLNTHGVSDSAKNALAVVSSSDAMPWKRIAREFELTGADLTALRKTNLIASRQGELWLEPVRPDLLGWAFAIAQLEAIPRADAQRYALLAWQTKFFDTGRFLEFVSTHGQAAHPWTSALQSPDVVITDRNASLNRAKAATNAVHHYGSAQSFDDMKAELAVSQAIARAFSKDREIQLVRAKAATNAVSHYGSAQRFDGMKAELAVSQAIAARFQDDREIQLNRASAAFNAVAGYGSAQRVDEMKAELSASQVIAARFQDDREIQLVRARAAIIAVSVYGCDQRFDDMKAELAVSEAIAKQFSGDHPIQLRYAQCLFFVCLAIAVADQLASEQAGASLFAVLAAHPSILDEPPFNEMLGLSDAIRESKQE